MKAASLLPQAKTDLLLGNDELGRSPVTLDLPDMRIRVLMCGVSRSINISVSTAITLCHLT
ncbi:MAG: hypothetical protein JSW54_12115 [Fidelibacterota bacterium]|nr:MAG: hypothetical protein JSW54_12115 [Candidatus Neomarinimicrobiota bacterium]